MSVQCNIFYVRNEIYSPCFFNLKLRLAANSILEQTERGSCSLVVRRLPGMREVLGSNPLEGKILCSPSLSEETINQGPNTPIPMMNA